MMHKYFDLFTVPCWDHSAGEITSKTEAQNHPEKSPHSTKCTPVYLPHTHTHGFPTSSDISSSSNLHSCALVLPCLVVETLYKHNALLSSIIMSFPCHQVSPWGNLSFASNDSVYSTFKKFSAVRIVIANV